jgi:hypothetical protein
MPSLAVNIYSSSRAIAIFGLMTFGVKGGPLTAPLSPSIKTTPILANSAAVQVHSARSTANQIGKLMTDGRVTLLQLKNARAVPSQTLRSIPTNGKIYVINQNGIIFGAPRQIDTHALTTAAMKPAMDALVVEAKRRRASKSDSVISATVVGFGENDLQAVDKRN